MVQIALGRGENVVLMRPGAVGRSGLALRAGSGLFRARIPRRLVPVFVVVASGALVVRLDGRRVGVALPELADGPSVAECWNSDRAAGGYVS